MSLFLTCCALSWETYSIGAVIGDATPGGGRANVASVVVGQEGLNAHKLRKEKAKDSEIDCSDNSQGCPSPSSTRGCRRFRLKGCLHLINWPTKAENDTH